MSAEHSQTAADTPSDTTLCKMGCGFFGSGATGGCCSKCWNDAQKKKENNVCVAAASRPVLPMPEEEKPEPMDVDLAPVVTTEPVEKTAATKAAATTTKKKKKASYKNMMKSMMVEGKAQDRAEKDMEALRKVTGGGAFSKIDKI